MADTRRHFPIQQLDLDQILQEAQHRWLRPSEICEILRNHQKFQLTPDPPSRPPAGSLFLFDRKALRYFRKDGHRWRKKKDGKTVREAHEKLKAGSVDVLHCYYAHGEDNENFQRRSYWMLDELEHIVLVHYREVKEGYRSSIPRVQNADPGSQVGSPQGSSAPFLAQGNSPAPTAQTSYVSSPNTVDWNGQALSSEVDDGNSGENPGTSYLYRPIFGSLSPNISLHGPQAAGSIELLKNHPGSDFVGSDFDQGSGSSVWDAIQSSSRNVHGTHEQKFFFEQPGGADLITHKPIDARLDASSALQDVAFGDRLISDADMSILKTNSHRLFQEHDFNLVEPQLQSSSDPKTMVTSATKVNNSSREVGSNNDQTGELKKLDSFGRWMDKEIGRDCDDSLMASDSGNYWNTLDPQNDDKEVSSLSRHMQLDVDSLGPSLSQEQLFSIRDFSPDWAYSGVETKVLITGMFLGGTKHSTDTKWSCMFGEIEVSAEVLIDNVIRCQAPIHAPGCVPFYVTCSNRLACSEIREFEYREKPYGVAFSLGISSGTEDVLRFQIRLAKMLCSGLKRSWLDCSIKGCDKCKLKEDIHSVRSGFETDWERIQDTSLGLAGNCMNTRDLLIENLLKDRLCEWLVCRVHEEGKGPNILDDEGQGVIHLTSALGYEWAMGLIVAAGVSPNFRDARGRTGLHWASYFGREGTVTVLVRLGAAPGAVEDPTPAFPGGQTAADLASSRGYKGIAGYLAEADLTSHLSLLTMDKSVLETFAATMAADRATATATQTTITSDGEPNEQLALRGSLAAVRNSAHAAAMIQAAFRARSFQHRQLTKGNGDISEVPLDLASLGSLNKVQRMSHYEDYLHLAAVKIQKKYRGWKGRNEFLKIRGRIVKIQAHVRGHQVRKQYKRVVWSVSIVEKAILRWRRKGAGLRGFRIDKTVGDPGSDSEKSDEYDFLRIGRKQKFAGVEKALARVQSMVRHPEARDQYMRMVTKFENLKMGGEESSSSPK